VITLSDAQWATTAITSMEAEYLVSMMSLRDMIVTPSAISPRNHLKLVMDDIEVLAEGYTAPSRVHVEELLEFGSSLDESSEVVVHCVMGMSRSTAAIIILLAQNNPGREKEIADVLFRESPKAHPNRLLLQIGDEALGCEGDLVSAVYKGIPFPSAMEPVFTGSLNGFKSFSYNLDTQDTW